MGLVKFEDRKQRELFMLWGFNNEGSFLSNFYPCDITLPAEGNLPELDFNSVENAYMAWKTIDLSQRLFLQSISAKEAKEYSVEGNIQLRDDYSDEGRLQIMQILLQQKFSDKNIELKKMLIETGECPIIEANDWGDVFFGVCYEKGYGLNHLGRLIMKIRDDISLEN